MKKVTLGNAEEEKKIEEITKKKVKKKIEERRTKMVSENTVLTKVINRKLKKCGFFNKELKPIGFDYLYENVSPDCIEYERCNCEKSKQYWAKKDKEDYLLQKKRCREWR